MSDSPSVTASDDSEVRSDLRISYSLSASSAGVMLIMLASSARVGGRPWAPVKVSCALSMSRSRRRNERGAQSRRRSSSRTAP